MKLIQYIGKSVEKRDSVRPGSGRVWRGHGAIQEVADNEAFLYAGAHPDAFREITREENEQFVDSMKGSAACANAVVAMLDRITVLQDIQMVHGAVERAAQRIIATPPATVVPAAADYSAQAADALIVKKLIGAIGLIDLKDERLVNGGWPKPESVEYVCGIRPTPEQLAMAMQLGFPDIPQGAPLPSTPPVSEAAFQLQERAQMALAEADDADLATLRVMAETFSIEFSRNQNTETLRGVVREGLTKLAG